MKRIGLTSCGLLLIGLVFWAGGTLAQVNLGDTGLHFDSMRKEFKGKAGDSEAKFVFAVTNLSDTVETVRRVTTSCGCTVAKLPDVPWELKPGDHGEIEVTVNLSGKYGTLIKNVMVQSDRALKTLQVVVNLPDREVMNSPTRIMDRTRNIQAAIADATTIFRGECRTCHVEPTKAKLGKPLFEAACGICHMAEHRASMVPDLTSLNKPTPADYWRFWIENGKPGTLMPGFTFTHGGPLSKDQVDSLVKYLSEDFVSSTPPGMRQATTTFQVAPPTPAAK